MAGDLFVIKNLVHEKVSFMINEPLKTLLFHFLLFRFPKFQRLIVKNLMIKQPNFIMDFQISCKVLVYYTFLWAGWDRWEEPFADSPSYARKGSSSGNKQSTLNQHGQGESDCLIKRKHCDGRKRC